LVRISSYLSVFHLTQCLLLGNTEQAEYALKWTKIAEKHSQHYRL